MGRLVLGALMLALAVPAFAQQHTLQVNFFRQDPATVVGRLKGFFAHENLEVKPSITPNSTEQMQRLSKGSYQIVSTAFDNVLFWSGREGAELIAVSQVIDRAAFPIFGGQGIKQWSDLRGKKLAVDAVDTAFALVLRRVLLDQGLDLNRGDYSLVAVGQTALRLESLKKGETFAAVLSAPFDTQAAAAGFVRLGDSSRALPDYPNTLFAVDRAWAAKERSQLVGFLRAWLAAAKWMRANRDEAIALVGADLKVDPKTAARLIDEVTPNGAINPRALGSTLALRNQFGLTPKMGPDIARYYDTQYFEAASK